MMVPAILAALGGFLSVDIGNTDIENGFPTVIGTFDGGPSAAGALVTGLSVTDLELNLTATGANAAWIGVGDGTSGDVIIVPFQAAGFGGPGTYIANDATWDISSYGLTLDPQGQINALTMFAAPFSGESAGTWTDGTLTLEYAVIPLPGILAITGLAILLFTSRKRAR